MHPFFLILGSYCAIIYVLYIICLLDDFKSISDKAWANPYKHIYLEIIYFTFSPIVLPARILIEQKKKFTRRVLLARQNLLQQEIIKIAENYDVYYRHYNSNEKISSYLQRTSRSCNPDIKLFREYLQKEKDPNLTLAASNVHSFHKNGWY